MKKNPKEIPLLESSWKDIDRIQEIENITVNGDALHIAVMKYESISDIATNDSDFERIEGITVWRT